MGKLSETDRKRLLSNKFVEKITASNVAFSSEFKIQAVKKNIDGQSPVDIFKSAGIDVSLFNADFPKKSISRWKKIYLEEGEKGLKQEKRGKGATGRPKNQQFRSLEAELEYLRLENDFLKKLHALAASKEKKSSK
jgi:transposase-like protein